MSRSRHGSRTPGGSHARWRSWSDTTRRMLGGREESDWPATPAAWHAVALRVGGVARANARRLLQPLDQVGGRDRPAEKVALGLVATELDKSLPGLLVFNPLGDHPYAEVA